MKCLLMLSSLLLVDVLSATPLGNKAEQRRWELVADGRDRMHLVDLNQIEANPIEPAFVPENDVVFLLYTRRNPTVGQRIFLNLASIQNSNFVASHPTRFTIHGWTRDAQDPVNIGVNAAYFQLGEYNMITVDWNVGAGTPNYITARDRVGPTGAFVARLVDFLHLHNFVRFADLHVIGHSLGGHMAGFVGKHVTRGRVQVIMSLDPAGPLFYLDRPADRVHHTDGVYVEVMHTNGGTQGFREPLGHADFFPNGGRSQPGCGIDVGGPCAHARTTLFYIESIHSRFTSRECQSFAEIVNGQCTPTGRTASMAGPVGNIGLTGNYFLETNAASPFSRG